MLCGTHVVPRKLLGTRTGNPPMATLLTTRFIETVTTDAARAEFRDTKVTGLELRVTRDGVKSWALRYRRKSDAKKRTVTLGRFPEMSLDGARKKAAALKVAIADGEDPAEAASERRTASTFSELADDWLQLHARPNKKAAVIRDDQFMLNSHILPELGTMRIGEITKRDIVRMVDRVAAKTDARIKGAAKANAALRRRRKIDVPVLPAGRRLSVRPNRVLALTKAIFRWALSRDVVLFDPTASVQPPIKKVKARDRDLSPSEIATLWKNIDIAPLSPGVRLALKLSLVTGQRIGETSGIARAELDLNDTAPQWVIPAERAKNGVANRVPLSPLAVALIREGLKLAGESPWLFPSPKADGGPIDPTAATKGMQRARPVLGVPNFRVHDLRRTAATRMAEMGVTPHTLGLVLNHVSARSGSVTLAHYVSYSFDKEKREALEAWGARLERIIAGTDGANVVQIGVAQRPG